MKKLTNYLLPIQTKDLYAKEAVSSISLAHDVADKINEIVKYLNEREDLTNEKILEQDGKIRKGVIYMKDNLANTIYDLLELMKSNGELDGVINEVLNKHANKFIDIVDPDDFIGLTDADKIQNAINKVVSENKYVTVLKLNREYDITGSTLNINKAINREKLIITGGKIKKEDGGYLFEKYDTSYVTDIELKDVIIRGKTGSGLKLINSPDFINVTIKDCKLENVDTIVESTKYLQNISLKDTLITGGDGNLFEAPGFYGLFVNGCTIEHRKGYLVYQTVVTDNMYDVCYLIDISHNLIEGFNEGGIVYLKKVGKVNITNNYFENMKNNIVLDTTNNVGVLTVDNNRLFIGSGETSVYGVKGLINILTNVYPTIHAHANKVENCYLIYLAKGFSVSNKINSNSNDVNNANEINEYTENGQNKNHEINTFPLVSLGSGINKYDRLTPYISDKSYTMKLTINDCDVRLTVKNGEIDSSISCTKTIGVNVNNLDLYFGIPVYSDDLTDVQIFHQGINIRTRYRFGGGNDKYLLVVVDNVSGVSQTPTIIANLKTGAGVRG